MPRYRKKKSLKEVAVAYNKAAVLYDLMNRVYFLGKDKMFRSYTADKLTQTSGDAILNLCCGTGLDFPFMVRKTEGKGALFGVDISSEMLQQAKSRTESKVNLVKADAALLPFRDKTFEAILVSFCLRITPTYEKAIQEASRVLKKSGRIGVLANHKPSGPLRLPGTILTKVLSVMSKIDFNLNLRTHLSKKFIIIEDRRIHGGLVQFLLGENRK